MGTSEEGLNLVQVEGQDAVLIERLGDPLLRALGERRTVYFVRIEAVGRSSSASSNGHLPLLLRGEEELEAAFVFRVVSGAVVRFGL